MCPSLSAPFSLASLSTRSLRPFSAIPSLLSTFSFCIPLPQSLSNIFATERPAASCSVRWCLKIVPTKASEIWKEKEWRYQTIPPFLSADRDVDSPSSLPPFLSYIRFPALRPHKHPKIPVYLSTLHLSFWSVSFCFYHEHKHLCKGS